MRLSIVSSLFVLMAFVTGCSQNDPQVPTLQKKLDGALKDVAAMKAQVDTLQQTVSSLQSTNAWNDFEKKFATIAYLTPADSGYSVIRFEMGYISVALTNVQPYANGSRVTLRFGNPTAATLTGVKMTLDWGETDSAGNADNADAKSRDIQLLDSLPAGSWVQQTFVLDSIPASKLGFVRVKNFSHQGMILSRRY